MRKLILFAIICFKLTIPILLLPFLCKHLLIFRYSFLIHIFHLQLYDFNYCYLILIIFKRIFLAHRWNSDWFYKSKVRKDQKVMITKWWPYNPQNWNLTVEHMYLHNPTTICTRWYKVNFKGRTVSLNPEIFFSSSDCFTKATETSLTNSSLKGRERIYGSLLFTRELART